MKITYTKHALKKFEKLSQHSFILTKKNIGKVIRQPDHVDLETDWPNFIASKEYDENHALRVVYKFEGDIIYVITFYPAEKERCY